MMKLFKRSHLLGGLGSFVAAFHLGPGEGRAAQFDYKLAHSLPIENPIHVRSVQMANDIKEQTQGRLQITIYPNAQLGGTTSMVEQTRLGSIQFTTIGDSVYAGVVTAYAIDNIGYAFSSWQQPIDALAGSLGAYLRKELLTRGLRAFQTVWVAGFVQVTTSTKPIRTVDDFVGLKMRTPPSAIVVDLFKTLGAQPIALNVDAVYPALQTHIMDGQEEPLSIIETFKLYEVQKYLSLTNHRWGALSMTANVAAWNALPSDIQAIVERNANKYAKLSNHDTQIFEGSLRDKMARHGLAVNTPDRESMRARLGPYYEHWKKELGNTAWDLLEANVGKLG